jgi:hypothetical protein
MYVVLAAGIGVAVLAGVAVISWRAIANTAAVQSGTKPSAWRPVNRFSGAVTIGRLFMNIPGTAVLEVDEDRALLRPAGPRWFRPVWIDRPRVTEVFSGPWHSAVEGGIRFRSDDARLARLGFWPQGRGISNGRDDVLAALRNLGWPVVNE